MDPYSRVLQRVLTSTSGIMSKEPELLVGKGRLYDVILRLKATEKTCIMLATTAGTIKRGTLSLFFEELEHAGIKVVVFDKVMPDPTVECVEEMAALYNDEECEAMVAVGGGSVIDSAKAALARVVKPHRSIAKLKGILNVRHPIPDLYAVPTTAGTGSEATAAAVITDTVDGVHYKYAISDPFLIPRYAVLDPELTVSLSPDMTATSGFDALTHAVEAYTNLYASARVKQMSLAAVKLIFENLEQAWEHGDDREARENMLRGSYYAGVAFTNNFVGYVHAVAHAIGGIYDLPHGRTVAILLPYVMEQYGSTIHGKLAELAAAAGLVPAEQEMPEEEAANLFLTEIRRMENAMGIPDKVEQLETKDYPEIIKRAIAEANPTYPVPVIWKKKDFQMLLDKVKPSEGDDR